MLANRISSFIPEKINELMFARSFHANDFSVFLLSSVYSVVSACVFNNFDIKINILFFYLLILSRALRVMFSFNRTRIYLRSIYLLFTSIRNCFVYYKK